MAVIFGLALFALFLFVVLAVMAAALLGLVLVPLLLGGLAAVIVSASGTADPVPVAIVVALVTFLVTRRRRTARRIRVARTRPGEAIVENRPVAPESPAPGSPLAETWRRARNLAPRHRKRLEAAELAGAALLREAEAQSFDLELHEAAMLLTRHAPDLVASAESLCAADPASRERCTEEMVAGLEELAGVSGEFATRRRSRLHDSFATIRRHIADRKGSAVR